MRDNLRFELVADAGGQAEPSNVINAFLVISSLFNCCFLVAALMFPCCVLVVSLLFLAKGHLH